MLRISVVGLVLLSISCASAGQTRYQGDGSDLQKVIDSAAESSIIACDPSKQMEFSSPIVIRRPLTLQGMNARLPRGLGNVSILLVESEGVKLRDSEFHGNYDSVSQDERAPLVWFKAGRFTIERCTLYDGSKDGVNITPDPSDPGAGRDIVGGVIRDLKGYRMGRDLVSISGGNKGLKIRDLIVENIHLEKGYHRGAVEVSDGTDNVTVRHVYAQDAVYALDVQDHGKGSAPNTNVRIEDVRALRCKHILRTANSARGHEGLSLRDLTGTQCALPLLISHTKNVRVEKVRILQHTDAKNPPIKLDGCQNVTLRDITIETEEFGQNPIRSSNCTNLNADGVEVK